MKLPNSKKTLWENHFKDIFEKEEDTKIQRFLNVISFSIYGSSNTILSSLYNTLGVEAFSNMISICDGRKVTFPTKVEYKDSVVTALCYYYRTIEKKPWSEIKEMFPYPINTIKIGKDIRKLKESIKKEIEVCFASAMDKEEERGEE